MDDYKDDGFGSSFFGGFGGFGGFGSSFPDMSHHMEEVYRQMEDMFSDGGNINIEFHRPGMPHPGMPGTGGIPPLKQNPRDHMLKENDTCEEKLSNTEVRPADLQSGFTPFWSTQNSHNGMSNFSDTDSMITGIMRSIQTVRNGDGSMERIEKNTENGRTCTTVTKTDPHGVSTTTTTCDRPAIGGTLSTPEYGSQSGTPGPNRPDSKSSGPPSMNTKDEDFFSKLFGNLGFKPKS